MSYIGHKIELTSLPPNSVLFPCKEGVLRSFNSFLGPYFWEIIVFLIMDSINMISILEIICSCQGMGVMNVNYEDVITNFNLLTIHIPFNPVHTWSFDQENETTDKFGHFKSCYRTSPRWWLGYWAWQYWYKSSNLWIFRYW